MAPTLFVLVGLVGLSVVWFYACRFVASRQGKIHVLAYVLMLFWLPGGVPGVAVGYKDRTGKSLFQPIKMP